MTVGDDASSAGFLLVPDSGEDGRVRWGAREINRTRDYVAQVGNRIPVNTQEFQQAIGIRYGTSNPTGGVNGDIYFKIM